MAQSTRQKLNTKRPDDSTDLLTEARSLRRKLVFWRRAAWLLLGIVLLILVVAWQRTTVRRRECRQSLEHYVEAARIAKLDQEPAEVLESQWQQLPKGSVIFSAAHYVLFVPNWLQTPGPGESLALAVCRDSHPGVFARGRHVLFRDEDGMYVEWLTEEEAASIIARIQQE